MTEKAPILESKRMRLESGEFIFDNDPRIFDKLVSQGVDRLDQYLEHLSSEGQVEIDSYLTEILHAADNKDPSAVAFLGIDLEDIKTFPALASAIICGSRFLYEYAQETPENLEWYESTLKPIIHDQLLPNFQIDWFKMHEDANPTAIISKQTHSRGVIWYTENAFRDFDATIADLATLPENNRTWTAISLTILGILNNKFAENHPHARYYWQQIKPFLPNYLTFPIPEHVTAEEIEHVDPPRLELLKKHWETSFVASWVARSRVEDQSKNYLTPKDRDIANQQVPPDSRTAEVRSGAVKHAETVYARTRSISRSQGIVSDYDEQTLQIEQTARKHQLILRENMDTILQGYNPEHRFLFDSSQTPVGEWRYFRHKIGRIFEVCFQHAHNFYGETTPSSTQQALTELATSLTRILEAGTGQYALSPIRLFGADFPSLAPIEQVSLVVFTALSIAKRSDRPAPVVELVSHKLQALLSAHHISKELATPAVEDPLHVTDYELSEVAFGALIRLTKMQPEHGFVSSTNQELISFIQDREALLGPAKKFFENLDKWSETKYGRNLKYGQVSSLITGVLLMVLGRWTAEVMYGSIEYDQRQSLTYLVFLLLGIWNMTAGIFNLPRGAGLDDFRNDVRKLDSMAVEFEEELEQVIATKKIKERHTFKWQIRTFIFVFIFGMTLQTFKELHPPDRDSPDIRGESRDNYEEPYVIPDQVNPESLRTTDFQYRGRIFQLPDGHSGVDGEVIGYQPDFFYLPGQEMGYATPRSQPFVNVEVASNPGDIPLNHYPDHLIYQPEIFQGIIYPLDGYEIVKIYHTGKQVSWNKGGLGEVSPDALEGYDLDMEVVIVAKKLPPPTPLDDAYRVVVYPDRTGKEYSPWENWPNMRSQADALNQQLTGDPHLQSLHRSMINEADLLFREFSAQRIGEEKMVHEWSRLGEVYSIQFGEYVDEHRMYSLEFEMSDVEGENSALQSIAQQPDQGYYCSVANISFQEFMGSIGIIVLTKPGATLKSYDGNLYSRIGHMSSAVLLPNKRLINTEMTPSRPTPGEDFSMLEDVGEPDENRKRVLHVLGTLVAGLTAASIGAVALSEAKKRLKVITLQEYVENVLPENSPVSDRILRAVEHIVAYVTDASTDEHWRHLQKVYGDQDSLYQKLAKDALHIVATTPSENMKSKQPGYDLPTAVRRIQALSASQPMTAERRSRMRDGLKLVRRYVNSTENASIVDDETRRLLSNIIKKILVETK